MKLDTTWVALFSEAIGVIAVVMLLGLSPRFKHRAVIFRSARYEGWTSLGLFGAVLTLTYVLFPWQGLSTFVPVQLEDLWPRLAVSLVGAGLILLVVLVLRRQPLLSVLLGRKTLGAAFQMGLALVFLSIFLRAKIRALFGGIGEDAVTALFAWAGIAAGQEIVLRGYLQTRLMGWLGNTFGWLLASVLSVAWMLPLWLPNANIGQAALFAGVALAQALLLGWIARRSGHLLAGILFYTITCWLWMI